MDTNHRTAYFLTFAALLVLLALTAAAAFVPTGKWAVVISLSIAVTKAMLIVLFFMHLREAVPLVRVFAFAGVFWLMLLLTFLLSDYLTREDVTPASEQISRTRHSFNANMLEYGNATDANSNHSKAPQT